MTKTTPKERSLLKGSWEAMLAEAQTLNRQGNREAIKKFTYLIERLLKLPEKRLRAQEHLLSILAQSLFGLQSYYARRNRLDEALSAYDDVIARVLDADAQVVWREHQACILRWQGRYEEAIPLLQHVVDEEPFDMNPRWLLFSTLIDSNRFDLAEAMIASFAEQLAEQFNAVGAEQDDIDLLFGFLHYLRAMLALEKGQWEAAFHEFAAAGKTSQVYVNGWHLLYRPLVTHKQAKFAGRALNREKSAASQGFWRGLSGRYAGDQKGAQIEWRRVTQIPLADVMLRSAGDWILAHYYLGDEDRQGLQVALQLLQQQQTQQTPLILSIAALGWGMHGQKEHLYRNLRFAVEQMRAGLQDNKLSVFAWHFFHDLLQPEDFAEVEQYFHAPKTH